MPDLPMGFAAPVFMAIGAALLILILIKTIQRLIVIVPPNMIAVITGRRRTLPDGTEVGYRLIRGGRTFRLPIIEQVTQMSLNTIPLSVKVANAFAKGGIPITVEAVANVKIASAPDEVFNNAVERLLGREREIPDLARETLAANLRGVLATLTPEEANEDRLKFEQALVAEASRDLRQLGLQQDMLKIQNISDDMGYLRAVGRIRASEVLRDAEIAEAKNKAETEQRQAESRRNAEVTQAQAAVAVAEAKNQLRVRQAQFMQEGETAERVARAQADAAEAQAQQQVQDARIELARRQLQAEQVEPARAARDSAILQAEADAAPVRAQGEAQAYALEKMVKELQAAGTQAPTYLFLQQLPALLATAVSATRDTKIDRLVVLDGGANAGSGVATANTQRLNAAFQMLETLCAQYGIDPEQLLRGIAQRVGDGKSDATPLAGRHGAS